MIHFPLRVLVCTSTLSTWHSGIVVSAFASCTGLTPGWTFATHASWHSISSGASSPLHPCLLIHPWLDSLISEFLLLFRTWTSVWPSPCWRNMCTIVVVDPDNSFKHSFTNSAPLQIFSVLGRVRSSCKRHSWIISSRMPHTSLCLCCNAVLGNVPMQNDEFETEDNTTASNLYGKIPSAPSRTPSSSSWPLTRVQSLLFAEFSKEDSTLSTTLSSGLGGF